MHEHAPYKLRAREIVGRKQCAKAYTMNGMETTRFDESNRTLGQCATLACLLEVTAPKPGNVHRGADFEDLTYVDFLLSASVIGPIFENAQSQRVGETVLRAVQATRSAVRTNTNLGTLLLLAPLARAPRDVSIRVGVSAVLADLDSRDAHLVYEAIRHAQAGGLGTVEQADVADTPPDDLLGAMRLAAERDLVARQYVSGFSEIFDHIVPDLSAGAQQRWSLSDTIVWTQIRQLRRQPDSLIARKCGIETARQASHRAEAVLTTGGPGDEEYQRALADLDFWLRSDGHRRNPGATADLLAAGLFVCLREGILNHPLRFYETKEIRSP